MNINDILKRQTIIITVTIIGICLTLIGVSYALFFNVEEGTTQIVESGDLVIQFSNGTLLDSEMIPIPDSEGEKSNGYTFSVTNKGSLPMKYEIYIYDKEGIEGKTRLDHQYIKVKLDNEPTKLLSELETKDNKLLLKDNLDVKAKGAEKGEDVRTHTIRIWIDEEAPEEIVGNIIALDIEVKGVVGERQPETLLDICDSNEPLNTCLAKSSTLKDLEYDGASRTLEDGSNQLDNNLRYVGKDPNNYIYFNCDDYNNPSKETCEKWRIIGLMNNMVKEDESKASLVKIVRAEPLTPNLSWDNKDTTTGAENNYGKKDWTDAELMYLLNPGNGTHTLNSVAANNSLYWESKNGKCSANINNSTTNCDFRSTGLKGEDNGPTKSMIETVVWNLGGVSTNNSTASAFYNAERGSEVYEGRPTIWLGKIGLFYPSDYGYAAEGECLTNALGRYQSSCYRSDWLFNSTIQWTLVLNAGSNWGFNVDSTGGVGANYVYFARAVRPSLYLKSNVKIKGGKGTSEEPYILVP